MQTNNQKSMNFYALNLHNIKFFAQKRNMSLTDLAER